MNAIAAWFSVTWMSSWAPLALDVVCKATALLSIAVLAAAILRRSSAAIRHRVWCLTFAGLLLLPALSAALPQWRLEVLPTVVGTLRVPQLITVDAAPAESGAAGRQRPDLAEADPTSRATLFADPPSFVTPGGRLAEREDYFTPAFDPATPGEPIVNEAADGLQESRGPMSLVALWLLGALVAASPLLVGLVRNYLLRRRAQPVAEAAWTGLLDELRNRLNLRRRVALYETQAALMPMTWGMLSPIVMLPHRARQWTDRLRRFVLLHELAHVKRCDVGFQMLARLACALYWFHPLAWYALRRLRIERELACDDCVVQAGERPSDYAAELLAIARNYRPLRLAAAVPIAQTSNLERRIRALFDKACSHLPISPRAARLLLLGTAVIVITIAVIRLVPRAAAEADEPSDVAQPPSAGAGTPDTDEQTTPLSRSESRHLGGTVLLPDGQPAAGVVVYARLPSSEKTPQLQAKTDDAGRFLLALPQPLFNDHDGSKVEILVYAVADGFAYDWTYIWGQTTDDVALRLSAEKAIEGRILDAEGRPLAGVELQVDDVARYRDNGMQLLFDDLSKGRNLLREYSHWSGTLPGQPDDVTTDADGRFRIAGLSTDDVVKMKVRGSRIRHTTFEATAALRDTIRGPVPPVDPPFPRRPGRVLYGSPFDYIAEPGRRIHGVVRDRRTGAPVPRAKVRCLDATTDEAETDEQGRFVLDGCAKQPQYTVSVEPAPHGPAYFPATLTLVDEAGLKPLSHIFELLEGVAVRGRIVDSDTGRPLEATVHYAPLYLNANVTTLFEQHVDPYTHSQSEPDGWFRIVVAPGPGVLGIGFPNDGFEEYLSIGVGYDDVVKLFERSPAHRSLAHSPELKRGLPDSLPTASPGGWSFISQTGHARMVLISPDQKMSPEPLEVRLVRGRTLQGRLIDPAGQPLTGATASGLYITGIRSQVISGSEFTVHAVGPDEVREISFEHQGRRLAAFRAIGFREPEPFTVRLVPFGGATGRVVDEQGGPAEGMHVWFYPIASRGMQRAREVFAITDAEGRFKIDELIAALQYEVSRSEPGATARRLLSLDKFSVDSGQTRDLGDLVLGSPVGNASAPAEKSAAAKADASVAQEKQTGRREAIGNQSAFTARGRVLDPAGKPLPGARVRVVHVDTESNTWVEKSRLLAETKSDADGAFSIDFRDNAPFATSDHFVLSNTVLLADAPGLGFGWEPPWPEGEPLSLQLVDDAAIEGRVLDLEGRPIAGVDVTVEEVSGGADDVDAWLEQAKQNPLSLDPDQMGRPIKDYNTNRGPTVARFPGNDNLQLGSSQFLPSAVTDAGGKFRLAGLGRDRLVRLRLDGSGIAKTWLIVVTHDMPPVPYPSYDPRFRVQTCFGRQFDLTAEPEQPIAGTIRDADTGEPLPGVEVRLSQYAGARLFVEGFVSATTDERGRYTLRGVPKPSHPEQTHRLRLLPGAGRPYFKTEARVPKQQGLGAVTCDVALKYGITTRGKVTDATTGKPVRGLVAYVPFLSNQAAAAFPNFVPGRHTIGVDEFYATDDDGRYEIPALPGRGVVALIAEQADRYPEADGADDIADIYPADGRHLNVYHLFSAEVATSLREVNLSQIGDDAPLEIAVRPLSIARLELADPEGRALVGVVTKHLVPTRMHRSYSIAWSYEPLPSAIAEIVGPRDTARTAMFLHRERRLAAAVRLTADRDPPAQVVLQPCATLTGRVVDAARHPVAELWFEIHAAPLSSTAKRDQLEATLARLQTNAEGRFRLDDVPPGLPYVVSAIRGAERLDVTTNEVQPGETLDLGDVVLKAPERTEEKTGASAKRDVSARVATAKTPSTDEADHSASANPANVAPGDAPKKGHEQVVRGRVLDPSGKPLAGAKIYFWYFDRVTSDGELRSTTTADGRFGFVVDKSKLSTVATDDPWSTGRITATAEGYGYQWVEVAKPDADGGYTLRLVDDVPVHGRILTLEGQPVVGANVAFRRLDTFAHESLDEYIAAWRTGRVPFASERIGPNPPGQPHSVTTDAGGRFEMRGFGAERVVQLNVEAPGIECWHIVVMTRDTETLTLPRDSDVRPKPDRVFGATFDYFAQPGRTIAGVVRERGNGRPIGNIQISGLTNHSVETDGGGRFELHGLAKADSYSLRADAQGTGFFSASVEVRDTTGLAPLEADIELVRGIPAEGKVTIAPSGEPYSASVEYYPLYPNPFVEQLGERLARPCTSADCGQDGRYRIVVLPGPGLLAFRGQGSSYYDRFSRARVTKHDLQELFHDLAEHGDEDMLYVSAGAQSQSLLAQSNYNCLLLINPSENEASLVQDAELQVGRTVAGKVTGANGEALVGVKVIGLTGHAFHVDQLQDVHFTVKALDPRFARELIFEHRELGMGAYRKIGGDEAGPLVVRLAPFGAVMGRLLDADGEPLAGKQFSLGRPRYSPPEFSPVSDAAGRFRVEGLVPRMPYTLRVSMPNRGYAERNLVVDPEETKDLGDVRLKPFGEAPQSATTKQDNPAGGESSPATGAGKEATGTMPQKNEGNSAVSPAAADGAADAAESRPKSTNNAKEISSTQPSKVTMVHGRVTRGGRPASGAHVAVIARRTSVQRGGELGWGDEVLAEATANENGKYSMTLADVSQQTHADATVVARQAGAAIAWRRVNLDAAETEAALDLPDEVPVRGQVIDVEGRPAAGVRISVVSVMVRSDDIHQAQGIGYHGGDKVPAAWFATVTSDAQGRFVLQGLAANQGVSLEVAGDDRFAEQNILLNTGAQEQRGDRDRTYRSLVKNVKSGEEAGLVLAPAQPFEGTVRYADTGQGVPHARITIWASQEQFGSMMSVAGRADEQGHYRISPRPGIRFGVTAYPPDGAAYLARDTPLDKAFEWKAVERSKQVDLTLPRGVLVRGRVVEAGSEAPVVGAAVQYVPESSNNPNATDDILTGWQAIQLSDRDGRFSMAVLPGPGRLLVNSQQAGYVLQEIGGRQLGQGKPGGMRNYAHAIAKIDPQAGQETLDVKLELTRGETVTGRIVDEAGKLVDEALVISRINISPYSLSWRGHTTPVLGGGFELAGLAKDVDYPIYFLDAKRQLGATEIIKAGDGERTVVLKPCGGAVLHVVDGNGEPVPAQYVTDEMVVTPGVSRFDRDAVERGELIADADFIANIDRINHPLASSNDESGQLNLRALIPGATYRLSAQRSGKPQIVKEFQVRANETLDLGEVIVERE